ncbi:MAG: hypothetical protein JWM16_6133, partial [Verrucomicrobiales bacterium]|nr:hypothetical protein [Verrucomicrobiales bacterium]
MKKNQRDLFSAQILTVILCAGIFSVSPAAACCQRMDGNREISPYDTTAVMIHEVIATLVVDSAWIGGPQKKTYTAFKVISKAKADTSLFGNVTGNFSYGGFP